MADTVNFFKNLARTPRKLLLDFADFRNRRREFAMNHAQNQKFAADNPDFPMPPAHLFFDAYGHTSWQACFDMGQDHANKLLAIIQKYSDGGCRRVCEWGCGPGRILRHMAKMTEGLGIELYGTDYNEESIAWCRSNLPGIQFARNELSPPLDFADDFFDCVYGISVLTHLSEKMHHSWIKELARVSRAGGLLILTTHGDRMQPLLTSAELEEYIAGSLVIRSVAAEGKKYFTAFHPSAYIRSLVQDHGLTVIEHLTDFDMLGFHQDIWVLRVNKA